MSAVTPETLLADAPLSARAKSCLDKLGVKVVGDIAKFTVEDLQNRKHLGRRSLTLIREVLGEAGLALAPHTPRKVKSRKEANQRAKTNAKNYAKARDRQEAALFRIAQLAKPQPGVALAFRDGVSLLQCKDILGNVTNVLGRLDILPGHTDRFGVPPHAHAPNVKLSGDFFEDIRQIERVHGPVLRVYSVLFRMLVEHTDAEKFYLCTLISSGQEAGVVVFEFDTAGFKGAEPSSMPEHKHWLAAAEPMPVQAALWIFENMTPELAERGVEQCNCLPPEPPMGLWAAPPLEGDTRPCPGLAACCEKPRGHEGACETSRPAGIVPRCHNVDASDGGPCCLPYGHTGAHLSRPHLREGDSRYEDA